jgi:hypothetical protein
MNTMDEGLRKIAQDLTSLKMAPDADLEFLIGIETTILQKLRQPFENAAGQMAPPPGSAVEAGMGAGMEMAGAAEMGAGAGMMAGAGAGPPMGMPGPGGPMPGPPGGARFSPDALRNAMRPSAGVQGGQ